MVHSVSESRAEVAWCMKSKSTSLKKLAIKVKLKMWNIIKCRMWNVKIKSNGEYYGV